MLHSSPLGSFNLLQLRIVVRWCGSWDRRGRLWRRFDSTLHGRRLLRRRRRLLYRWRGRRSRVYLRITPRIACRRLHLLARVLGHRVVTHGLVRIVTTHWLAGDANVVVAVAGSGRFGRGGGSVHHNGRACGSRGCRHGSRLLSLSAFHGFPVTSNSGGIQNCVPRQSRPQSSLHEIRRNRPRRRPNGRPNCLRQRLFRFG